MPEDMDQDKEDLPTQVDLVGPVEQEQGDHVDRMDPVDQTDQADPMDQDQDSLEDAGEEAVAVAVAVAVGMADPQSAREDTPAVSTPTSLISRHTPSTSIQISFRNGLRTHT